jgi:hypothetical protein
MHTKWLPPWHLKATPSGVKQDISQAYHCVLVGPPPIHLANLGPHKKKPHSTPSPVHRNGHSPFYVLLPYLKRGEKEEEKVGCERGEGSYHMGSGPMSMWA